MALNKNNIKTLIENVLISFHDNILKNKLVPTGGTTGQVLSKASDTDNDVQWTDMPKEDTEYETLNKLLEYGLVSDALMLEDGTYLADENNKLLQF